MTKRHRSINLRLMWQGNLRSPRVSDLITNSNGSRYRYVYIHHDCAETVADDNHSTGYSVKYTHSEQGLKQHVQTAQSTTVRNTRRHMAIGARQRSQCVFSMESFSFFNNYVTLYKRCHQSTKTGSLHFTNRFSFFC